MNNIIIGFMGEEYCKTLGNNKINDFIKEFGSKSLFRRKFFEYTSGLIAFEVHQKLVQVEHLSLN